MEVFGFRHFGTHIASIDGLLGLLGGGTVLGKGGMFVAGLVLDSEKEFLGGGIRRPLEIRIESGEDFVSPFIVRSKPKALIAC